MPVTLCSQNIELFFKKEIESKNALKKNKDPADKVDDDARGRFNISKGLPGKMRGDVFIIID